MTEVSHSGWCAGQGVCSQIVEQESTVCAHAQCALRKGGGGGRWFLTLELEVTKAVLSQGSTPHSRHKFVTEAIYSGFKLLKSVGFGVFLLVDNFTNIPRYLALDVAQWRDAQHSQASMEHLTHGFQKL